MTTPVTSELLPCPFCGKIPNDEQIEPHKYPSGEIVFGVICDCGGQTSGNYTTKEFAADAWNRRSQPSGEPVVKVRPLGTWRRGYCDERVTIEQASFGGLYQVRVLDGVVNLDWPDRKSTVYDTADEAKAAAEADYEQRIRSAIEPSVTVKGEPGANLGVDRLAIAKAFHDGPLGADDHDFRADSKQGKWCLDVVDFFIGQSRLNAETGIKTLECSICGLPMPEGETMFKFHGHSGPCPQPAMLDTAYAAAVKALEGTSGDIGVGELERVVMAVLAAATAKGEPIAWRVKHGGGFTIWNSEANARNNADATNGTVEPLSASPPIEPAGVKITDEMVERGLTQYSEGGCMGLDQRERREVVTSILTAALEGK